jgi:hypothetical protein
VVDLDYENKRVTPFLEILLKLVFILNVLIRI